MNLWVVITAYLFSGAMAGILSGLLGIGGGLVMVPALLFCFSVLKIAPDVIPALALGTSLTTIAITAFFSCRAHYKLGNLADPFSKKMRLLSLSLAIGVIVGAHITTKLSREHLFVAIGSFQFLVAIWMWRRSMFPVASRVIGDQSMSKLPQDMLPNQSTQVFFAGVGAISSISGIGGATLMIPYFDRFAIPYAKSAALSSCFGCVIGLLGFLSYGLLASASQDIGWSIGYVNLPAVAAMAAGSYYMTSVGAKLSNRLSGKTLSKTFAALLLLSSAKLLLPILAPW